MDCDTLPDGAFALLEGTFLFCDTPRELLHRALSDDRCVRAHVARGETIYTPKAFQQSLGILLSGSVQVSKQALIVSVLGPGELFGAAALFHDEADYVTTLTAHSDCDLIFFPQPLVEALMAQSPAMARGYITYLSGRIRFLNRKIEGLIAGSAERKLAQYLMGRGERVALDCSATGLAKRLDVSRASLYRAFDALVASGAVEKNGKTIFILDETKLHPRG